VRGRDPLSATIQSKLIDSDIFKHVDQLCTSGSGDPFASSLFWSLIDHLHSNDYPRLRLSIQSNGILLTEKNLVRLGAYNSRIDILSISIDGASPDTYAQNRRGGDWEVLMNNLANIVRRNIFIQLNMIVQQNNYREMPAFVRLARSFSANRVYLSALENWGTYDDADFQRRAVHLPNHPEHEDLLRVLDDDNLQDPNFITMGCLPKRTP
jgi:MoaA/NifB/PqqE/SkfB family radical SAM enzyme